jgi:sulfonate transport system substrate-binding protein
MSLDQSVTQQSRGGAGPADVWYTRCPVPTASGIAWHFGWLRKELQRVGVRIESIRSSPDRGVRVSHFTHAQPFQFREGGNIPPLWARGEGANIAVVGITWVDEEQVILVRPDSEIKNVGDLKGRRLGLPKHETQIVDVGRAQDLHGFVTALTLAGLRTDEVEFVDVAGTDYDLREDYVLELKDFPAVAALAAGDVDAIYAKGAPSALLIRKYGLRTILDINAQSDPLVRVNNGTPRPVTVDRDLASRNPELVGRYLAVLLHTARWAEANPDGVVRAIAAEIGTSEASVRTGYGPEVHRHFQTKLSSDYVKGLESQKDFLRDWGFIKDFDFDSWIDPAPLQIAERLVAEEEFRIAV